MATMWTSADEAAQQGFDSNYYLTEKAIQLTATTGQTWTVESTAAALEAAGLEPYQHYQLYGYNEGLAPNAYFDSDYYVASKAAAAGVTTDEFLSSWNAISGGASVYFHYIEYGAYENDVNPSSSFGDYQYYVEKANQLNDGTTWQEVREIFQANGLTAISHYMLYGESEGLSPVPVGGATYSLTTSQDVQTANVFNSVPAWSPGGDELVNTLQNFDVLTGTGTNPTLNVQLGDANDSSGTTISPTLNGIETINAAFIGSAGAGWAVNTLDMQDATGANSLNITRISDGNSAFFRNITSVPAELSLSNTNSPAGAVGFVMTDAAVAGDDDSTTMTLNNATVNNLLIEGTTEGTTAGSGVETINLVSSTSANAVGTLFVDDIKVLNISGDQNLTIGNYQNPGATGIVYGVADGDFTTINGADATGNLTLLLNDNLNNAFRATTGTGEAVDFKLDTGSGDDTLYVTTTQNPVGQTADVINMGTGNDTVAMRATTSDAVGAQTNFTFTTSTSATFEGVEAVTVTRVADTGNAGASPAATLNVDGTNLVGDQTFTLSNLAKEGVVDGAANFVLTNLSATEAASGISITHSTTSNNGLLQNNVSVGLADASGASDTVGLTLVDGVNSDPLFNATLTAGGTTAATRVENITLTDSDSESNSVALTNFAQHTGTITVTGGQAGQFMNLDASATTPLAVAGGGAYGYDITGANGDLTTTIAANTTTSGGALVNAVSDTDSAVGSALSSATGGELLVASTIDATGALGDVIARVGTADQTISLGAGNDTIIFADRTGITAGTAGLTVADHVTGGAGTDTIVLDGAGAMTLGDSEWTNLSGIDTIRLAGTTGSNFQLTLSNHLVDQTDSGSMLNIINNDGDLTTNAENSAVIDLRNLTADNNVNFVGANGDGTNVLNAQQVLVNDVTSNGSNHFNGGDANVVLDYVFDNGTTTTFASQAAADAAWYANVAAGTDGNSNLYSIHAMGSTDTTTVTVGDLANTQNFSQIVFQNDQASAKTLNLTLDNATVDQMVDASHTATTAQVETLSITAIDNGLVVGANAILNIDATTVGDQFRLNITGGAGNDIITAGAGADTIITSAGDDIINGGAGDDLITAGIGKDVINGGTGSNTYNIAIGDSSLAGLAAGAVTSANLGAIATGTANYDTVTATVGDHLKVVSLAQEAADAVEDHGVAAMAIGDAFAADDNVAYWNDGTNTFVVQDANGNGTLDSADSVVVLTGVHTVAATAVAGATTWDLLIG